MFAVLLVVADNNAALAEIGADAHFAGGSQLAADNIAADVDVGRRNARAPDIAADDSIAADFDAAGCFFTPEDAALNENGAITLDAGDIAEIALDEDVPVFPVVDGGGGGGRAQRHLGKPAHTDDVISG